MTLTLGRNRTGVAVPGAVGTSVAMVGAPRNPQTTVTPVVALCSRVDTRDEGARGITQLCELCGLVYVLIWDETCRQVAERVRFCLDDRPVWADLTLFLPVSGGDDPGATPSSAHRPATTQVAETFHPGRETEFCTSMARASGAAGTTAQPENERELAGDLAYLRGLLERGKVEEGRAFVRALARRWPAAERVRHLAQVLAPPVVSQRPDVRPRPLDRERAWLRGQAHAYPGRWMAVLGDGLIAADPDLRVVLARVRETPGGEQALLHYQPGSAD